MLILTRKKDESIIIGDDIEIVVTQIAEDKVKIGIIAPKDKKVFRKELIEEVKSENINSAELEMTKVSAMKDILKHNK